MPVLASKGHCGAPGGEGGGGGEKVPAGSARMPQGPRATSHPVKVTGVAQWQGFPTYTRSSRHQGVSQSGEVPGLFSGRQVAADECLCQTGQRQQDQAPLRSFTLWLYELYGSVAQCPHRPPLPFSRLPIKQFS
ncbi:hypothetical protein ACOMHN_009895 [Nucella lapillus]